MPWGRLSFALILLAFQNSGRFDVTWMDRTCKPCEDFYQFVNGNWIKDNPPPASFARWGTFQILQESNLKVLRDILEDAARSNAVAGTNEQIVGSFYASCMDESRVESRGAAPIADELARIDKVGNIRSLQAEVARLHEAGMSTLFIFGASHDYKNSSQNIAWALQGGLSLPNKDYYTKTDDKSRETRDGFVKHVARMFELLGDQPGPSAKAAETVMRIEMQLADASMNPVERRNPAAQDNKRTIAQQPGWNSNRRWVTDQGGGNDLQQKTSSTWVNAAGATPFANGIHLLAGTQYYIEGVMNEFGGGDNMEVTFYLTTESPPADGDAPKLTGSVIGVNVASATTLSTEDTTFSTISLHATNTAASQCTECHANGNDPG